MTYNPLIPIGNDSPANQQAGIQTNFAQFSTVFGKNHTALNLTNQGDHEDIILEKQTSDPGVVGDYCVIYAKDAISHAGTQPQLFLQVTKFLPTQYDTNNIDSLPMQLTYNSVNTAGPVYQSFLPGGYIFYFGNISTGGLQTTITLSPAPTKILMALAQSNSIGGPSSAAVTVSTNITSNTTFDIYTQSSGTNHFSWQAIASA